VSRRADYWLFVALIGLVVWFLSLHCTGFCF
jgi:hypothetical protein